MRPGSWRTFFRTIWLLGIKSARRRMFWSLLLLALRRSSAHVYWAVVKAVQGEHFVRFTEEVVLPRLAQAIAAVDAERRAPVAVPAFVSERVSRPA